jgi:hypothetical protein
MDAIKSPDDMGKDWRVILNNAEKVFKTPYDPDTAKVHWQPFIVDEISGPPQPPRFHD